MVRVSPDLTSVGNASGGINLRTIDFAITWSGTRDNVHFTEAVDNDGVGLGFNLARGRVLLGVGRTDPGVVSGSFRQRSDWRWAQYAGGVPASTTRQA
jgi:hypothetical protein